MEKGLSLLLDTNIWLERLLDQERSKEVKVLLESTPTESLFMSDFTLHSIGVILFKLKKLSLFNEFVNDLFDRGSVKVISLSPLDQIDLIDVNFKHKLDFDDAYQYQVALKYDLVLVTFDADFKKSKIKTFTPNEVTQRLKK